MAAKTECSKRTNNVKFFSVYIDCNPESESTLWSCEAVVEFRLHSQSETNPVFSRQFTNKFNFNSNNWGFPSFMEWTVSALMRRRAAAAAAAAASACVCTLPIWLC